MNGRAHLRCGPAAARGRVRRSALACAVGSLLAALLPAGAVAANSGDVDELLAADCPSYKAARQESYPGQEVAAARRGDFDVHEGKYGHLVPPVDWRQDPYGRQSWRHSLHAFPWIDILIFDYLNGHVGSLAQARDLALSWIKENDISTPGLDHFAWQLRTAGDRAGYIGYIARAASCEGLLNRDQAATLVDGILAHGDFLSEPAIYRVHNQALSADLGLGLAADYGRFLQPAPSWDALARRRFESTLRARSSWSEGVWHEHSPKYQVSVANLVDQFSSWVDTANRDLPPFLERMRESTGWMVMPDGLLTQFGDTDLYPPPSAWARKKGAGDRGLRVMPESGLAFVKRKKSYLSVAANYFTRVKKHEDELGFELYERGRRVISDTGRFAYEGEAQRVFALSAAAHSVLTVDGVPFTGPRGDYLTPYHSAILATGRGGGWYAIKGWNPRLVDQGVRHSRLFLYRPGVALIIVDRVRSRDRHVYRRYLQLGPEIAARLRRGRVTLRSGRLRGRIYDRGTGKVKRNAVRGRTDPLLAFTFPRDFVAVPRWTIVQRSRARNLTRVQTISFGRPRCAAMLRERHGSVLLVSTRRHRQALKAVSRRGRIMVKKGRVPHGTNASWPCRLARH